MESLFESRLRAAYHRLPANFLFAMRVLFPDVQAQPVAPPLSSCTIDGALAAAEAEAATKALNDPAIIAGLPVMQQFKTKYRIGPDAKFDMSKFSPEDTRIFDRTQASMQLAYRELRLAQDIQNILDWWRMANLVYETRKEDLSTYGPDMSALGNTIEAQKNSFDDRNKAMLGLWAKVNEKILSDDMKMLNAMAPAIDAANKLNPPKE
jgi:hypothetical protein